MKRPKKANFSFSMQTLFGFSALYIALSQSSLLPPLSTSFSGNSSVESTRQTHIVQFILRHRSLTAHFIHIVCRHRRRIYFFPCFLFQRFHSTLVAFAISHRIEIFQIHTKPDDRKKEVARSRERVFIRHFIV